MVTVMWQRVVASRSIALQLTVNEILFVKLGSRIIPDSLLHSSSLPELLDEVPKCKAQGNFNLVQITKNLTHSRFIYKTCFCLGLMANYLKVVDVIISFLSWSDYSLWILKFSPAAYQHCEKWSIQSVYPRCLMDVIGFQRNFWVVSEHSGARFT